MKIGQIWESWCTYSSAADILHVNGIIENGNNLNGRTFYCWFLWHPVIRLSFPKFWSASWEGDIGRAHFDSCCRLFVSKEPRKEHVHDTRVHSGLVPCVLYSLFRNWRRRAPLSEVIRKLYAGLTIPSSPF